MFCLRQRLALLTVDPDDAGARGRAWGDTNPKVKLPPSEELEGERSFPPAVFIAALAPIGRPPRDESRGGREVLSLVLPQGDF